MAMTDPQEAVAALKKKQEKARTLLTQAQTRAEALQEQIAQIEEKMAAMNVTPENAEDKLAKLLAKRDAELAEKQALFDGIDL